MSFSKTDRSKVKETTCRNLAFASDFEIKIVDGIVVEAICTSWRKKVKAEECSTWLK